jgi:catechol 2,3-dioxygenase-like lactoylglutathione lyase family enzyme
VGCAPSRAHRSWRHRGLARGTTGREILLANRGDAKGWVRLVTLSGTRSAPIRPAAQAWDPGGWYSLMVRTRDAQGLYDKAIARGWTAANSPQEFAFGGVRLRNVVIRAPDGVNFALYERLEPKLDGWESIQPGGMSRVFNVMTMVSDFEADRAFFQEGLGWGAWFIGDYNDVGPTPTNFGLPVNMAPQVPRRSGILWESPGEDGRVEIMRFVGLDGVDHAPRVSFANRGITALRLPVADLDAWTERARARGVTVTLAPAPARIAPYGQVRLAHVRSPNGCVLEVMGLG